MESFLGDSQYAAHKTLNELQSQIGDDEIAICSIAGRGSKSSYSGAFPYIWFMTVTDKRLLIADERELVERNLRGGELCLHISTERIFDIDISHDNRMLDLFYLPNIRGPLYWFDPDDLSKETFAKFCHLLLMAIDVSPYYRDDFNLWGYGDFNSGLAKFGYVLIFRRMLGDWLQADADTQASVLRRYVGEFGVGEFAAALIRCTAITQSLARSCGDRRIIDNQTHTLNAIAEQLLALSRHDSTFAEPAAVATRAVLDLETGPLDRSTSS
ncbi:MAG: hypothetical protein ACKVVP_25380 [Chloroflexota bacterium]